MGDAHRLTCAREFDAVFNSNEIRASSRFFLILALGNGMETSRLGTVVSKKVAKNAVNRNRIRRLIKESFRQECNLAGYDFVVVARSLAGPGENRAIFETLRELWQQLEIGAVKK
jgi:ribonuclease P protein component